MKVIFMGKNKESSCMALEYLLENNIEVVYAIVPENKSEIGEICKKNNIEIIKDTELYELIKMKDEKLKNIDLVLSFLFWKKIKKPIIDLSKKGCVNFHPAPLPEYRGVGGYNFAILDDLDYWGVSSHYVDETIDTGQIIKVQKFFIDKENINTIELEKLSQEKLLELFKEFVKDILENKPITSTKQSNGKYINKEMLEKSKEITINSKKEDIDKKIRAFWFPPYNGAYIEIDGKKYTLINDEMLKKIRN